MKLAPVFGTMVRILLLLTAPAGLLRAQVAHLGKVTALAFSPGGRLLFSVGEDGRLLCWDGRTGAPLGRVAEAPGPLRCLAVSARGVRVAAGGDAGILVLRSLGGAEAGPPGPAGGALAALAFVGDQLLTYRTSGRLQGLSWRDGAPARPEVSVPTGNHWAACFSPDGRWLALGEDEDLTVRLVDVATGAVRRRLEGHAKSISALAFSPDGALLATGDYGSWVRLFEVATGRQLRRWRGGESPVYGLAFSPDGTRLASASKRGRIYLWDPTTAEAQATDVGGLSAFEAESLAFSPGGGLLAIGGSDPAPFLSQLAP